eukprot:evm.model.scf_102.5 EVM.evm.TU.scf_102.5   scf_102:60520-61491(+)
MLPQPEDALRAVKQGDFLGKRDLRHGFHHVVLDVSARRLMGFRHPETGRLFRWRVLPFGAKQSPGIFCGLTTAAAQFFMQLFKQEGIICKVLVYLDDFLLIALSHQMLRRAFAAMDRESQLLGLVWKHSKDEGQDTPTHRLTFLGLDLDTEALALQLPDNIFEALYADPYGIEGGEHGWVMVNDAVLDDLIFWRTVLPPGSSPWDGTFQFCVEEVRHLLERADEVCTTDAAAVHCWGAVWREDRAAGQWSDSELCTEYSTCTELRGILHALCH